jgi:hypothetical protein
VRFEEGVLVVRARLGIAPVAAQDVLAGGDEPPRPRDRAIVDRVPGDSRIMTGCAPT